MLTKYNGQTLTYDMIGNPLIWRDGMTMTWAQGRNLVSLQTSGKTINYTYDADGLRITKTVDGVKHTYQYVDGLLMYETRGDLKFIYSYDAYGHLSCITYMWADGSYWNFYVACNARGDVTAIYAADGTLRATYTYDSWGNTVSIIDRYGNNIVALGDDAIAADNIGALNRIRYRGYYYDYESGLYYLQSRYYDPQVKRFVNADEADVVTATPASLNAKNLFAYCDNNPVSRVDATGRFWDELWNAFNQAVKQSSGYFAGAALVSQADSPAPGLADLISAVLLIGGLLYCGGDAIYTTTANPTKDVEKEKELAKDVVIPMPEPPKENGTTYYHVTTPANAAAIKATGIMIGSSWESLHVYAWRTRPSKYAIKNSGAHFGVIISFKTNVPFVVDTGIEDSLVMMFGPVVSSIPGPIRVWDVEIVG